MFLASFQHTLRIGINDVLNRKLILAMKLDNKGKYMNSAENIRSISEIMMMPLAAKALCVAAEIGIADKIGEQGITIAELAKECQASEKNIFDIIKVLEVFGFFEVKDESIIKNNARSALLMLDNISSMKHFCMLFGNEYYQGFDGLLHTGRTGESGFKQVFGLTLYEHLAHSSSRAEIYDLAMRDLSRPVGYVLAKEYASLFKTVGSVVDIGGGSGVILTELIKQYHHLTGCLFDMTGVCNRSEKSVAQHYPELKERMAFTPGSFFEAIPSGYDVYLLKNILHNWNDEFCLKILKAIAQSIGHSTLLIIEPLLEHEETSPRLLMNALFQSVICQDGTRYRTLKDMEDILTLSGLTVVGTKKITTGHTVVEIKLSAAVQG
ncbi:methyltransferase [Pectobacterium polaris]|uniref:methyltransferase n=1 Tax=Pectobacterium polaris TaxID=2042057 RepID=UPI0023B16A18|nr:methyltransferase [Pectobacterium polaris]MDE8754582.1 methyltransferase [Pectobacterium polaris]